MLDHNKSLKKNEINQYTSKSLAVKNNQMSIHEFKIRLQTPIKPKERYQRQSLSIKKDLAKMLSPSDRQLTSQDIGKLANTKKLNRDTWMSKIRNITNYTADLVKIKDLMF